MRRVVIHKAGGYDQLKLEEFADPRPKADEVVVRSEAIGVNYADVIIRMGLYESAKKYVGWPITPGFEFAGRVAVVGEAVADYAVGDRVFGVSRFFAYASHVCVPQHQLFPLPSSLSPAEAAAFPSVHLTAYYALFELARPRAKSTILVHSAAGGVGSALVRMGKIAGCTVVGVVGRSHKVDYARRCGADRVIDKSKDDLWPAARQAAPHGYQAIFDANGVATLGQSYAHVAPAGRLVIYGFHSMMPKKGGRPNWLKLAKDYLLTPRFNPLSLTNDNVSVMAFNLSYLFERHDILREAMSELIGWLEEGTLAPAKIETYSLDDVARAHADIESGQTVGKLVLTP